MHFLAIAHGDDKVSIQQVVVYCVDWVQFCVLDRCCRNIAKCHIIVPRLEETTLKREGFFLPPAPAPGVERFYYYIVHGRTLYILILTSI